MMLMNILWQKFFWLRVSVLVAVLLMVVTPVYSEPSILTGYVTKVRDGDTIEVGKVPIRLNGVSAPEMNEPLGPKSKAFMIKLILNKHVRCELNGERTHDRFVGICYLGGQDIGEAVIEAGLALDCPRYSGGRYKSTNAAGAIKTITLPKYCQ